LRHLQAQFKGRKVEKHYIALVEGKIEEEQGRINAPIGRDPRNRKRMAVIVAENPGALKARPATTEYRMLALYSVPLQNDCLARPSARRRPNLWPQTPAT
jgi:23S rRNA pseudouridine1911/1915/1917 synthase